MGGNVLDRLVPEAEREYLCAEDVVVHSESCILYGNSHTFACAGHSTSPANPYRHEKGRTRWDALESTVGSDHREEPQSAHLATAGLPQGVPMSPVTGYVFDLAG